MSKFVREDGFNFVIGKVLHERVAENNSLRFSDAGEARVSFFRRLAEVEREDSCNIHTRVLAQRKNAFLERVVF